MGLQSVPDRYHTTVKLTDLATDSNGLVKRVGKLVLRGLASIDVHTDYGQSAPR